jgi:thiaminase (transcriptional activator TenA)
MFVDECMQATAVGWQAYEHHPWFEAFESGELPLSRFIAFQVADAPFVPQIHRTLALGLAKAPTASRWSRVASRLLSEYFVADEIEAKRRILEKSGVTACRFDFWALVPAREAYANHMVRTGLDGTIGEIAAALLPCAMFTKVVGQRFRGVEIRGPEAYRDWADYYANKEGMEMAQAHAEMMEIEAGEGAAAQERMLLAFARSLQHQIAVFDAALAGTAQWPATGVGQVDGAPVRTGSVS